MIIVRKREKKKGRNDGNFLSTYDDPDQQPEIAQSLCPLAIFSLWPLLCLIWEQERPGNSHKQMNTVSSFRICSFNLRGFSKNDPKLQMIKLLTAIKFHNIIGMLEIYLNQEEVATMVKNNKQTRLGCFDVTAMLSWRWLKLRLIEVEVDWS